MLTTLDLRQNMDALKFRAIRKCPTAMHQARFKSNNGVEHKVKIRVTMAISSLHRQNKQNMGESVWM